jgi:hypothetical protein
MNERHRDSPLDDGFDVLVEAADRAGVAGDPLFAFGLSVEEEELSRPAGLSPVLDAIPRESLCSPSARPRDIAEMGGFCNETAHRPASAGLRV